MRIRIKRKKLTLVVSGIAVLALAGAALAYWTASGSGSGDATAGTDSGVTITNVTFDATLYPAATVNVKYDANNSSTDTPAKVGDVVADTVNYRPTGVTVDLGHSSCGVSDFTYSGSTVNTDIAASGTYSATYANGGTLTMADTGSNQDACKGATLTLHLITDNSGI